MMAVSLLLPAVSRAQGQGANAPSSNTLTETNGIEGAHELNEKNLRANLGDPKEEQAYQSFHNAQDANKKIELGQAFMNKYPSSRHIEGAYDELAQAYYSKLDLPGFYANSDKGIAKFPDDVVLLTLTGWVIPRVYRHDDPDGDQKLAKAENYEKHALDVMNALTKPVGVSDEQFDLYKTQELEIAHSGLGLIYFRQEQYDNSLKELQQAVEGAKSPDPSDLFVLGADLQNLNRFKEAADAFNRCAQIAGTLQDNCKQYADRATKLAGQAK